MTAASKCAREGRNCGSMAATGRRFLTKPTVRLSRQRTTHRAAIDVPTFPVLCFIGTKLPLLFPPRQISGVVICTPNNLVKRLDSASTSNLNSDQVGAIVEILDGGLG